MDTPTSACAAVFVGRNEVIGRAQPHVTLTSPVTGQACVWFQWQLQRWKRSNKSGRWVNVEKRSTVAPFWVVDDTGGILVRPRGAKVDVPRTLQERAHHSGVRRSRQELRSAAFQGQDAVEHRRTRVEGSPGRGVAGSVGWLLVAVKQQAANSWSLIDVALRRRHDLLPDLVEVAKRYARHEKEVLEVVAGLRLGEVLPASEELPEHYARWR